MCIRMLPRPNPSTTNSNNNSSISFALPASPNVATPSSAPPSGPPATPQLSSPDVKLPASWSPSNTISTPGAVAGSAVSSSQPGQLHTPHQISTPSSQEEGSAGGGSAANLSGTGSTGVVVVGVIGRESHELSSFVDRLLDHRPIGVKSRFRDKAQDRHEELSASSPDLVREFIRDRKQKRDGNRSRGSGGASSTTSAHEDVAISRDDAGGLDSAAAFSVKGEIAPKSGRSGKSQVKNAAHHDRRKDEDEGGAAVDDHQKTDVNSAGRNGRIGGGDDDPVKTGNENWKENTLNVPWLLNKLKYYHDVDKGVVYLQFHWGLLSNGFLKDSRRGTIGVSDLHTKVENSEADDMRGLLFMFSVCHVILFVQDGTSFDPRLLRIFRLLQTAKHCLAPFIKTQILPGLLPAPSSSSSSSSSSSAPSPLKHASSSGVVGHAFGRAGTLGRTSSTVALMSGSTPALIPGQCIPVVLFIYLEDVAEQPASSSSSHLARKRGGDLLDGSYSTLSQVGWSLPILGTPSRENHQGRIPNVEGETGRSGSSKKSDIGMRKKMQAALEQQIIMLLKKCRTIAGFGDSSSTLGSGVGPGMGSRAGGSNVNFQGVGGGGALFVLDPSRAVILLDRAGNWQTDALDVARDNIEAMMATGIDDWKDFSFREHRGPDAVVTAGGDDIQVVKDFLLRQVDILRGKGGLSGSNASASAAGVGMVAAAAAAAAASAASGLAGGGASKPVCNSPELPTFGSWSSACKVLGVALSLRLPENLRDKSSHSSNRSVDAATQLLSKKGVLSPIRMSANVGNTGKTKASIESSLTCLETSAHMDMKFSAAWCKRVLPSALGNYLNGLPPCYPTSLHKSQLAKTLRVFRSMVRGYAVPIYAEKLQMKCEAIWHSGRQLCDAESLTGKPCIHQVHDISGTAAVHSHVPNGLKRAGAVNGATRGGQQSEKQQQLLLRPHSSGVVFLHACACGRSRKLRQDPFDFESANISFFRFSNCDDLLPSLGTLNPSGNGTVLESSPWSLVRLGSSRYYQPTVGLHQSGFVPNLSFLSMLTLHGVTEETQQVDSLAGVRPKDETFSVISSHGAVANADQGKPLPSALHGSETKAAPGVDYGRTNKIATSDGAKGATKSGATLATPLSEEQKARFALFMGKSAQHPRSREKSYSWAYEEAQNQNAVSRTLMESDTKLNFGALSNADDDLESKAEKEVRFFIGFEYECPHGHRFLLSVEESLPSRSEAASFPSDGSKHKKIDQLVSQAEDAKPATAKTRYPSPLGNEVSKSATNSTRMETASHGERLTKNQNTRMLSLDEKYPPGNSRNFHGPGHPLVNSNLPIYMRCPYCKGSEEDKHLKKKAVFGGTISQLQRVFLVTPPLPHVLASRPVVKFEDASQKQKRTVEFSPGGELVLPSDSFLSLRLPFVYYSESEGIPQTPLLVNQENPDQSAMLVKNTVLYCL